MIFVTSNPGKAREARGILGENLERKNFDYSEIQADSIREVAADGAEKSYREFGEPCFVDDSGLFIDTLDGFPGPYSSYVHATIENKGILNTMNGVEDREAEFRCVVGYSDGSQTRCFSGVVKGVITTRERGDRGFGFDPIFEYRAERESEGVEEISSDTFAEMREEEKNLVSHRKRALEEFRNWL